MKMRYYIFALLTLSLSAAPLGAQGYTRQGATLGGVAGAIAGGIIGHQNDETPEGALIGGAVGAIAGGLFGNAKDERYAQNRYYQHQAWQQQQRYAARAVSMSDVVHMSRSGVSDSVILNHIAANGVIGDVNTSAIIQLHQQGVSETVITAMQQAPHGTRTTIVHAPPPRPRAPTVVVQREYHVVPHYAPPHRRVYHSPVYGPPRVAAGWYRRH